MGGCKGGWIPNGSMSVCNLRHMNSNVQGEEGTMVASSVKKGEQP